MNHESEIQERYETLKEEGSAHLAAGRLEEALERFERAEEAARRAGDADQVDLAFCNRSAVAVRLARTDGVQLRLQETLLRTTNRRVAVYSAYNLALAYDRSNSFEKSLFYARIAHRYAAELRDGALEALALNQIGNVLTALNQFQEALEHFRKADGLLPPGDDVARALLLDNLGYCHAVLGRFDLAFPALFRSLRLLRKCGAELYEAEPRLALCFAYLGIGRPGRAIRHVNRALDIAERSEDARSMKYALLLLGEGYKVAGHTGAARDCFRILQESYYPDMPEVPGLLLGLDVCKVINLRA
ncbi:MAG: hypothetical protein ACLF0P_03865 [Thermoanaerobaculia bacterium]